MVIEHVRTYMYSGDVSESNIHFHGIHPSEVYWTGKQQLLGKMDHQVRHDIEKIWRKDPLEFTHDVYDVCLHFPEIGFSHFPCA